MKLNPCHLLTTIHQYFGLFPWVSSLDSTNHPLCTEQLKNWQATPCRQTLITARLKFKFANFKFMPISLTNILPVKGTEITNLMIVR